MLPDNTPKGGLYIIWFSSVHYYGGRTTDFKVRWRSHLRELEGGVHGNCRMQATYNKYGHFQPEVLSYLCEEEQEPTEQGWLDEHFRKAGCINLSPSSKGGCAGHTPETCAKMSETRASRLDLVEKARETIERNRLQKGEKKSPEALAKIQAAGFLRRGTHISPEHVAVLVEANRGRKNTPETIALMSESAKARALAQPTVHADSTKALISEQQRGRVWITDGTKNQRLFPDVAAPFLESGTWQPGKTLKPGTVYKNKGRAPTPEQLEAWQAGADKRKGRARSQEAVEKTAAANKGRKNGPEALENMKAAGLLRRGRKRDLDVVARIQETKSASR